MLLFQFVYIVNKTTTATTKAIRVQIVIGEDAADTSTVSIYFNALSRRQRYRSRNVKCSFFYELFFFL